MSILIKGMEIPENCKTCPFIRNEYGLEEYEEIYYCRCSLTQMPPKNPAFARSKNCPLVEIPPHGRLIDADEMFIEFVTEGQRSKRYKIGEKWELNGEEIRGVISRLPTIIEAEVDDG